MSKETQNNTPVSVEPVVTLNGAQLLQALDFIAPDRDTDPQQLECELTISFADGPAGSGYYCYCTDYPDEGAIMLDAEAPSALVAAQPDITQQTLDDVMAGIPARDAEIEALRKENATLRAGLAVRAKSMAYGWDCAGTLVKTQSTMESFKSDGVEPVQLFTAPVAVQAQPSLTDTEIDRIAAPWLHPDGQANASDVRAIVRAAHAQPISIDQQKRTLANIEAFVACDASAISYLSLGEYRTALLKMLRQAPATTTEKE